MKKSDKPLEKDKDKDQKKKDDARDPYGYTKQSYAFVEELKKAGKEYTKEKESEPPKKPEVDTNNPLLKKPSNENSGETEHKAQMKMGNKKWRIEFSNIPEGDQLPDASQSTERRGSNTNSKSREDYILGAMYPSPHITRDGTEDQPSKPTSQEPSAVTDSEKRPEHQHKRRTLATNPELDSKDLEEVDKFKTKGVVKLLMDAEDKRKREEQAKHGRKHDLNTSEGTVQQRKMFSYMPGPMPAVQKLTNAISKANLKPHLTVSEPKSNLVAPSAQKSRLFGDPKAIKKQVVPVQQKSPRIPAVASASGNPLLQASPATVKFADSPVAQTSKQIVPNTSSKPILQGVVPKPVEELKNASKEYNKDADYKQEQPSKKPEITNPLLKKRSNEIGGETQITTGNKKLKIEPNNIPAEGDQLRDNKGKRESTPTPTNQIGPHIIKDGTVEHKITKPSSQEPTVLPESEKHVKQLQKPVDSRIRKDQVKQGRELDEFDETSDAQGPKASKKSVPTQQTSPLQSTVVPSKNEKQATPVAIPIMQNSVPKPVPQDSTQKSTVPITAVTNASVPSAVPKPNIQTVTPKPVVQNTTSRPVHSVPIKPANESVTPKPVTESKPAVKSAAVPETPSIKPGLQDVGPKPFEKSDSPKPVAQNTSQKPVDDTALPKPAVQDTVTKPVPDASPLKPEVESYGPKPIIGTKPNPVAETPSIKPGLKDAAVLPVDEKLQGTVVLKPVGATASPKSMVQSEAPKSVEKAAVSKPELQNVTPNKLPGTKPNPVAETSLLKPAVQKITPIVQDVSKKPVTALTKPTVQDDTSKLNPVPSSRQPMVQSESPKAGDKTAVPKPVVQDNTQKPVAVPPLQPVTQDVTTKQPVVTDTVQKPVATNTLPKPIAQVAQTASVKPEVQSAKPKLDKNDSPVVKDATSKPVVQDNIQKLVAAPDASPKSVAQDDILKPVTQDATPKPFTETTALKPEVQSAKPELDKADHLKPVVQDTSKNPIVASVLPKPVAQNIISKPAPQNIISKPVAQNAISKPVVQGTTPESVVPDATQKPFAETTSVKPATSKPIVQSESPKPVDKPEAFKGQDATPQPIGKNAASQPVGQNVTPKQIGQNVAPKPIPQTVSQKPVVGQSSVPPPEPVVTDATQKPVVETTSAKPAAQSATSKVIDKPDPLKPVVQDTKNPDATSTLQKPTQDATTKPAAVPSSLQPLVQDDNKQQSAASTLQKPETPNAISKPVVQGATPEPVVTDATQKPVAETTAVKPAKSKPIDKPDPLKPVVQDTKNPDAASTLPKPIAQSESPKPNDKPEASKGQNVGPKPIGQNAAPQPISKNVAPQPIGKNAAPQPIGKNTALQPVGQNAAPQPIGKNAAPKPVPQTVSQKPTQKPVVGQSSVPPSTQPTSQTMKKAEPSTPMPKIPPIPNPVIPAPTNKFQFVVTPEPAPDPVKEKEDKAKKIFATLFNKPMVEAPKPNEINELKDFEIPDQARPLELLLDDDTVEFDFGGLMRQYYSYILRSYSLINMQDRYRGASNYSKCFTSLDVSKIGSKEEEQDKTTERKMKKLEIQMQDLKSVAVDQDHFNYLKNLAHTQPITLPLTILHGITEEMVPVLEDFFRFYGKNLGMDHHCTKKAGVHYVKMRKRVKMYCKISGGSSRVGSDEKEKVTRI